MRLKPALYYAGVAAAVAGALVVTLHLWERRLEVPFAYEGDSLFLTVLTKVLAQDGSLHSRHLGMPFGVDFADWGLGLPVDFTVLRALATVFGEPGTAINVWWLVSVVATSVFATFAFRALDFRPSLAFGLGYLYALSPYAFSRNVDHIVLVYHFVPLVALLATRAAEGRPERLTGGARAAVLLGCAGQGLSYIYYSFFSCVLLGAAGALGWLRTRRVATLKLAAAGLLLILTGTAVGLAPSLLYWREHGRIPELRYKAARESDAYGLKLRHLLLPIPDHPFPPFRSLAKAAAEARFPLENENTTTRLGTVGSLGFLGLLAYVVGSAAGLVRREHGLLGAAAALTVVALLVAQVGGLGSLFNLLVTPDIRAYNRIFVFVAFFSLLAAGLGVDWLQGAIVGRHPDRAVLVRGGVLVALLLTVFDQATTAVLRRSYAGYARRFDLHEEFLRRVESRLPTGAMVFQLPHTQMPAEKGSAVYDHGYAYVHSRALRWSWGAWTGRHGNWQAEVQRLEPTMLVRTLALAGFSGVWIDRYSYEPPTGRGRDATLVNTSPESAIVDLSGGTPETSLDGRYVFVSIEAVRRRLVSTLGPDRLAREREHVLRPPLVPRYREGFGDEQGDAVRVWRKCGPQGRIVLMNHLDREREVLLTARVLSPGREPRTVEISSPQFRDVVTASAEGHDYLRTAFLPARRRLQLQFSCAGGASEAPGSEGCFLLEGFRVVDLGPAQDGPGTAATALDEES